MPNHPDDERLDDSYAALTQATRTRQRSSIVEMSFVAGAAVLIAVSTAFGAWSTFELRNLQKAQMEERRLILLGTECIVEQFADHRSLNAFAHRAAAKDHGYTYPIPPDSEPPVIPGVLEKACATFITSTTVGKR